MKKLIFSLLILSIFLLSACGKKQEILFGPKNLTYDSETMMLTWDKDEQALGYKLSINDEVIDVEDNQYSLSDYEIKEYFIKVRSVYEDKVSLYSDTLNIKLQYYEKIEVYIKDNQIIATPLINTTYHYEMIVDISKVSNMNNTGIIDIPTNFRDRVIQFKLDIKVGNISKHYIETEINLLLNKTSKDEDLTINVKNPKKVYIDGEVIEATLEEDKVIISKDILMKLNEEVILSIVGDEYILKRLYVTSAPVRFKSPSVINQSDELKFVFELNGFSFIGIAKNEFIQDVDYFFNEDTLTFSETFIADYKKEFPTATEVSLTASFKRGTEWILLPFTIKLDA
ncbi:MAG: hypothetical protein WC939_02600 [Acholeplasmataceae bacterium]